MKNLKFVICFRERQRWGRGVKRGSRRDERLMCSEHVLPKDPRVREKQEDTKAQIDEILEVEAML